MTKLKLPDGREIDMHDLSSRRLLVPVGATITVPADHEWTITAMSAPPIRGYVPPVGSETRHAHEWGDVQITLEGSPNAQGRTSVLTLMDSYWGRCNLSPEFPDVVTKLTHAQHALVTAPKIPELLLALERAVFALNEYLAATAPSLVIPITVRGERRFTVERIDCENAIEPHKTWPLDVELFVILKRPVS